MNRVKAPGGQAAGRDIHNHLGPASCPPPDDHPHALNCPQCGRTTWALTRQCLHCGMDISAWEDKRRARNLARRRGAVAIGCGTTAWVLWSAAQGLEGWPMPCLVVCAVSAVVSWVGLRD